MDRGIFITMEGIEGCGKSTQCRILHEYLSGIGLDAVLTHEPGGTGAGLRIRETLLKSKNLSSFCELFLFMADRSQHVEELIRPALSRGAIVVCDRFYHSTFAYQSGGRGIDMAVINILNDLAISSVKPDLTFYIDISPETGLSRKQAVNHPLDRIEKEDLEFHYRVREFYKRMASNDHAIALIDGERETEEIAGEIKGLFLEKFNLAV